MMPKTLADTLTLTVCLAAALLQGGAALAETTTTTLQDGVRIEKVAEGFVFPEGPLWHPDGYLVFSDIHDHKIIKLLPGGGTEPWINFDPPRKTNGLLLSNDRKTIYAAGHGELAFLEINAATKQVRVLSKDHNGRKYLDVNDVAQSTAGHVYFTDPKWGEKPGDVQGIYRIDPHDGTTTMVAQLDKQPNGITISPDQKWLYVDRCGADEIWRYPLNTDGSLGDGSMWCKLDPRSAPDGMTIDKAGNLYVAQAGDGRITIISPEGKKLRSIKVFDRMCTNCEFENAGPGAVGDGHILYATGDGRKDQRTGSVIKLTFAP